MSLMHAAFAAPGIDMQIKEGSYTIVEFKIYCITFLLSCYSCTSFTDRVAEFCSRDPSCCPLLSIQ